VLLARLISENWWGKIDILDPADFSSVHVKLRSLAVSAVAKLSHNINKNKSEELVFNSDSEVQCISNGGIGHGLFIDIIFHHLSSF
jgi:hypothetical protein